MEPLDIEALKEKAEPVKVKPLEWNGRTAPTPFGTYTVQMVGSGQFFLTLGHGVIGRSVVKSGHSVDAAKAAAQADYEQRILSALDLSELSRLRSENDGMRKALEAAATWLRNGDYNTRGGLIEMSRLAGMCEAALSALKEEDAR